MEYGNISFANVSSQVLLSYANANCKSLQVLEYSCVDGVPGLSVPMIWSSGLWNGKEMGYVPFHGDGNGGNLKSTNFLCIVEIDWHCLPPYCLVAIKQQVQFQSFSIPYFDFSVFSA